MPHLPRRFRTVRPTTDEPGKLAPSDVTPPDLVDVYDDLPVAPSPPTEKPEVVRNPVVRQRTSRAPGLDRLSIKTHTVPTSDITGALFGK